MGVSFRDKATLDLAFHGVLCTIGSRNDPRYFRCQVLCLDAKYLELQRLLSNGDEIAY